MSNTLLLIVDVPEGVRPRQDFLAPCGQWQVPAAFSAADLATVLTGVPVTAHGVLDEWELRPDGQDLRAAPRHRLKHQPWWESVDGAIAVGLPWSTGSQGKARCVSAEFAEPSHPGAYAALPGRVWPAADHAGLAALRLAPDELAAATLTQLGFHPTRAAQHEMANWLSLHMVATALLENTQAPLALVRLALNVKPDRQEATADFIAASVQRYRALWQGSMLLLLRTFQGELTVCEAFGDTGGATIDDAAGLARLMTKRPAQGVDLPAAHWDALRARYQAPAQAMPGIGPVIAMTQARVTQALQLMERQ